MIRTTIIATIFGIFILRIKLIGTSNTNENSKAINSGLKIEPKRCMIKPTENKTSIPNKIFVVLLSRKGVIDACFFVWFI